MGRVHEVLHWANRSEVAREITRRGYRVSVESLNRWVRDEKEFPAVVERIVFDLFTISGHEESPPAWAEGLADKTAMKVIEALREPEREATIRRVLARLEALQPPPGATSSDSPHAQDRGGVQPPGREGG